MRKKYNMERKISTTLSSHNGNIIITIIITVVWSSFYSVAFCAKNVQCHFHFNLDFSSKTPSITSVINVSMNTIVINISISEYIR